MNWKCFLGFHIFGDVIIEDGFISGRKRLSVCKICRKKKRIWFEWQLKRNKGSRYYICCYCKKKIAGVEYFLCPYCGNYHCAEHRLPEDHDCENPRKPSGLTAGRIKYGPGDGNIYLGPK